MVRVDFEAADAWFEEDMPMFVPFHDTFRRVDVLFSKRPLKARVRGRLVAETNAGYHLHEAGLPCQYYVPAASVDLDRSVLRESETTTVCPYKGVASYYNVKLENDEEGDTERFRNLVWCYKTPTWEVENLAGCLCFYQNHESVKIELDGKVLSRPETPWS